MPISLKETLQTERIILKEARELYQRDPKKYGSRVLKWYLFSFAAPTNCETATTARASYYFLRLIDDILDLDRRPPEGYTPLTYALNVKNNLLRGQKIQDPHTAQLLDYVTKALEKKAQPGDNVRQELANGIDWMIFDHDRAAVRSVLPAEELELYYQNAFSSLVNIMLIGLSSKWRANDIPQMASVQARMYAIRDFEDDWNKGVINAPNEVLTSANLTADFSAEQVLSADPVNYWLQYQYSVGMGEVAHLRTWLSEVCDERLTRLMINSQLNRVARITSPL